MNFKKMKVVVACNKTDIAPALIERAHLSFNPLEFFFFLFWISCKFPSAIFKEEKIRLDIIKCQLNLFNLHDVVNWNFVQLGFLDMYNVARSIVSDCSHMQGPYICNSSSYVQIAHRDN